MHQPVTIENDAISMEVWPHLGGKVSSLVDKADKYELMFNFPTELPTRPQYDMPFEDAWCAGWDECFPAIAPSKYTGHPYDGIAVPDHGELWGMPTTAVPTKDGITTVWHGLRFGYRLTRKMHLEGPTVLAEYTLINLAPFEFRYVWSAHAMLSMASPAHIDLESPRQFRYSHDAEGVEHHQSFEWPLVAEGVDLSRTDHLPMRKGWKAFSQDPITAPLTIQYPDRNRSVTMEFASDQGQIAYWGIWVNTGGWGGHKQFGVEPTTGRYDAIDRSIRDGSAGRVGASGRMEWSVKWTLNAGV